MRSLAQSKLALVLLGLFASSLIAVHSLSRAIQKDFWLDEVYEIIEPLTNSLGQIWTHGATGTPSSAPLYFTMQKAAIPYLLKTERQKGRGYDWRVSLRVIPAFSLALGVFLAFILVLDLSALVAFGLPIFLCCYNFALFYGGETRIYGTWLGLSLAFYAATLRLALVPRVKPWGIIWCLLCVLLTLTSISSPIIIGLAVPVLIFASLRSQRRNELWAVVAVGLALTVVVFYHYKVTGTHFTWKTVGDDVTWNFISTEGLRMLEGFRKSLELVAMVLILIGAGIFGRRLPHRRLFCIAGLISLSQIGGAICVFVLQKGTGYWFAPRHAIFILAAQALASSCFVLLCFETLNLVALRWNEIKAKNLRPALFSLVISIAFLNWFQWRILTLPQALHDLNTSVKPYCHGPVLLTPSIISSEAPSAVPVHRFNWLNEQRHSLQCTKEDTSYTYNFSPPWIYGP